MKASPARAPEQPRPFSSQTALSHYHRQSCAPPRWASWREGRYAHFESTRIFFVVAAGIGANQDAIGVLDDDVLPANGNRAAGEHLGEGAVWESHGRVARSVHLISGLMEYKVKFVAAVMGEKALQTVCIDLSP